MSPTVYVVVARDEAGKESVQGPYLDPALARVLAKYQEPARQARAVEIPLGQIARERYREMQAAGERQDQAAFKRQMGRMG